LATIHQRYRRTDGQTDFLWHRPGPNGRPKTVVFFLHYISSFSVKVNLVLGKCSRPFLRQVNQKGKTQLSWQPY